MVFLVLYVDYIFDSWKQYQNVVRSRGMVVKIIRYKGLGRMYIFFKIKVIRDHKKKYIYSKLDTSKKSLLVLSMQNSSKGFLPFKHGVSLSKEMSPMTLKEIEDM